MGNFTGFDDVTVLSGHVQHVAQNTIARTDTTAKTLCTLPANSIITGVTVYSPTASDAATTATISVGKAGTAGAYLSAFDVKGAGGAGQQNPTGAVLGSIGASAVDVLGIYAETGTASSTGGPWTIYIRYETR